MYIGTAHTVHFVVSSNIYKQSQEQAHKKQIKRREIINDHCYQQEKLETHTQIGLKWAIYGIEEQKALKLDLYLKVLLLS